MTVSKRQINLNKTIVAAVIANGLQIAAAAAIVTFALVSGGRMLTGLMEQTLLILLALIVVWGAAMDIHEAFQARRIGIETDMVEDALSKTEAFNNTLRAQRHDFMNHLQVVYSLMEMNETAEAQAYIEKVYSSIQKVGKVLKTGLPAVNALLAAKSADCEAREIQFVLNTHSSWDNLPMPAWEMCRILGNLIDNAVDALEGTTERRIIVTLGEDITGYTFAVENNGPEIPTSIRTSIFQSGFTTKSTGHGMGLSIVREILAQHGGTLTLNTDETRTVFSGRVTKKSAVPATTE